MKKLCLIFLVLIVSVSVLYAEEKKDDVSWLLVPLPIYSQETSLKGIVTLGFFYNKIPDTHSSNVQLYLSATLKQQFALEVESWNYTAGNDMKFYLDAWHKKYPDSFFGTGNDTYKEDEDKYTNQMNKIMLEAHKKIYDKLYAGIRLHAENFYLLKSTENGLLASGNYNASRGGTFCGAGAVLSFDSRDNTLFAKQGLYLLASALYYGRALGSDREFMKYEIDLREYFKLDDMQSFAVEQYAGFMPGNTPVQMLLQFGGDNKMRGYFYGRYRDKSMIFTHAEYRIMPWERLGFAAFAGAGDVFDSDISKMHIKFSGGLGIRICLVPEERANIRIDLGYGKDGLAFIVGAFEAF